MNPATLLQAATKFGVTVEAAKGIAEHLMGGGYGNSDQNAQNVGFAQGQTQAGYDASRDNTRSANDRLMNDMTQMNDQRFNRGVQTGNMQRQADFTNNMAMSDQQSRSNLAAQAIQSYDNARQANNQFMQTLNQAGAGRMY